MISDYTRWPWYSRWQLSDKRCRWSARSRFGTLLSHSSNENISIVWSSDHTFDHQHGLTPGGGRSCSRHREKHQGRQGEVAASQGMDQSVLSAFHHGPICLELLTITFFRFEDVCPLQVKHYSVFTFFTPRRCTPVPFDIRPAHPQNPLLRETQSTGGKKQVKRSDTVNYFYRRSSLTWSDKMEIWNTHHLKTSHS